MVRCSFSLQEIRFRSNMCKQVDIQIDNTIIMQEVTYNVIHNVMYQYGLTPTPKYLSILEFHKAFMGVYFSLLAIEHSFEHKEWTYPLSINYL